MTDDLLKKIDAITAGSAASQKANQTRRDGDSVAQAQKKVSAWYVFFYQVVTSVALIYRRWLSPVFGFLERPVGWLWFQYRRLWDFVVYTEKDGQRRFSKIRGAAMILWTIGSLWGAWHIVLPTLWDAGWYAATARVNETVYLTDSQEIYPDDNIHAVKGCEALPCSDQNTIYFRVRPQYFHHLWSMVHEGSPFTLFFPDFIAPAVAPGLNKCKITSYGIRLKFLMRNLDIYPDLLAAECVVVSKEQPR